jgi:hypothetical protein
MLSVAHGRHLEDALRYREVFGAVGGVQRTREDNGSSCRQSGCDDAGLLWDGPLS